MILGVGNDVQDALVRQTIGIQPYLSLPRINDVPVQWVQLLNGFDQQDLYGWPLPTPLKVQMQKCDKCSREFCSTINYRRHIRVHRRSNVDKEVKFEPCFMCDPLDMGASFRSSQAGIPVRWIESLSLMAGPELH